MFTDRRGPLVMRRLGRAVGAVGVGELLPPANTDSEVLERQCLSDTDQHVGVLDEESATTRVRPRPGQGPGLTGTDRTVPQRLTHHRSVRQQARLTDHVGDLSVGPHHLGRNKPRTDACPSARNAPVRSSTPTRTASSASERRRSTSIARNRATSSSVAIDPNSTTTSSNTPPVYRTPVRHTTPFRTSFSREEAHRSHTEGGGSDVSSRGRATVTARYHSAKRGGRARIDGRG